VKARTHELDPAVSTLQKKRPQGRLIVFRIRHPLAVTMPTFSADECRGAVAAGLAKLRSIGVSRAGQDGPASSAG
jgi:hypothetical protein